MPYGFDVFRRETLDRIARLEEDEEEKFEEVAKQYWKGDAVENFTSRAMLINFQLMQRSYPIWVPFSQMRKDDTDTVYFAKWLLKVGDLKMFA